MSRVFPSRAHRFKPENYSGLQLWLKSDTGITTVSGNVSNWANQASSGATLDFAQATSGNRPALVASQLNGYPAVRFNGTTTYLSGGAGTLTLAKNLSNITVFGVLKTSDASLAQYCFNISIGGDASTARIGLLKSSSNTYQGALRTLDADGSSAFPTISGTGNTAAKIITLVGQYGTPTSTIYMDSISKGTGAPASTGPTSNTNSAAVVLGARGLGASSWMNGDWYELLVYQTAMIGTTANLARAVESYFRGKYLI
jgi:hypothetical protein